MIPGVFAASATGGGGGGGAWTPADLAVAPKIWLDWDSEAVAADGLLEQIENRGALGGSFSQSNGSRKPAVMPSELGGKDVYRFDGSDDQLVGSSELGPVVNGVSAAWVFAVYRKTNVDSSSNRLLFFARAAGASGRTRFSTYVGRPSPNANCRAMVWRLSDNGSPSTLNRGESTVGEWHIDYVQADWVLGEVSGYADGVQDAHEAVGTGTTNSSDSTSVRIAGDDALNNHGDFDLAVLLVGSGGVLSTAERQALEGWAAWNLGRQGTLPVDHPYRNAPPTK